MGGVAPDAEAGKSTGESSDATMMERENAIAGLLDEALMALAEADRRLIVLRYLQNRPLAEVAGALKVRSNTAAKRVERALERMRQYMTQRGVCATPAVLMANLGGAQMRHAPPLMAAKIANAAAHLPGGTSGFSMGVIAMTVTAKLKLGLAATVLLMLSMATYVAVKQLRGTPAANDFAADDSPLATTITGTVHDNQGKPVADALISQGDAPGRSDWYFSTQTDREGTFVLHARKEQKLLLAVQGAGYSPELIRGEAIGSGLTPFSIVLQPGHKLRAKFVDGKGNPIANLALDPVFGGQQVLHS